MRSFFSKPSLLHPTTSSLLNTKALSLAHDHGVSGWFFFVLVVAYLLPGIIGHDPWKQDETYIFGIIHHLLNTGDWVVPTVAGEPFMEKPPLYYWVGAGFAKLFSPWLSFHDAARFATGLFMVISCGALEWSGRLWWGVGRGRIAVLAFLSCLGLILHSHMMLTDIPVITGLAVSLCGFALMRQQAIKAGVVLGLGVSIGFLAKGVLAPGVIGLTAILLPIGFKNWRTRHYGLGLLVALVVALPSLFIWPTALYLRSPTLFMEWFWMNNVGRFLGFSVPVLGAAHPAGFWWINIPWFTFPALPLAVCSLWQYRRECLKTEAFQVGVLVSGIFMAILTVSASARSIYALPMLAPLSLLAVPALSALSERVNRWWDWSARIIFGVLASIVWFVWGYKILKGVSPDWAILTKHLPPEFVDHAYWGRFSLALGITGLAIYVMLKLPKIQARGVVSWVMGLSLFWGLIAMLWMPWLDYAKSYRSVFNAMQMQLPKQYRCVESSGLGESERAMLRYVLGINTLRREVVLHPDCDVLLVDGFAESPPKDVDSKQWRRVWEGARPGDTRERLWLFEKVKS